LDRLCFQKKYNLSFLFLSSELAERSFPTGYGSKRRQVMLPVTP